MKCISKIAVITISILFIGICVSPVSTTSDYTADCIDISSGFGITVIFRNPEPNPGYNLTWSIKLNGIGFLSQRNFSGKIEHIDPYEIHTIWKVVFGLYYGEIRVDIRTSNDIFFFENTIIFVFGPLVHVRKC